MSTPDRQPAPQSLGATGRTMTAPLSESDALPGASCPLTQEGTAESDLPRLAGLTRADQRRHWERGNRLLIESYLQLWPAFRDRPALLVDLVVGEFLLRDEFGESPTLEEYQQRFPTVADALARNVVLQALLLTDSPEEDQEPERAQPNRVRPRPLPRLPLDPSTLLGADLSRADGRSDVTRAGPATPRGSFPCPQVPGYEILGVLGKGGMGVVFKAWQRKLKRIVALKMIRGGETGGRFYGPSDSDRRRFRTEAEAIARVNHPHIVHVYEVGEIDPRSGQARIEVGRQNGAVVAADPELPPVPYMVLEFCPGGSLAARLDGTPLPPTEAARLVVCLSQGMEAAHRAHIIHRDLKPANVLLTESDTPKIADFGLAKKLVENPADREGGTHPATVTTTIMGTPSYMAPEQAAGRQAEIGPSSDIYALGAILYELLTGRPPFKAASVMDTVMQVLNDEPVPPRRLQPKVPFDLETICLKCLQKESVKRYPSAEALAADLQRYLDGKPIEARPVGTGERIVKWARRRPGLALMSALCVLTAAVSFALVSWKWWEATVAQKETANALEQEALRRREAHRQLKRAEAHHYLNRIALAQRERLAHNVVRAVSILDDCPPDLRAWEWFHLRRQCRGGWKTISVRPGAAGVAWAGDHATAGGNHGTTGAPYSVRLRVSPDGKMLATGGEDGVVVLWSAQGQRLKTIQAYPGRVLGLAFHPEGKELATVSDRMVRLWDVQTGLLRRELVKSEPNKGEDPGEELLMTAVAYRPDGKELAAGTEGGAVLRWDLETGKLLPPLVGHSGTVHEVAYRPGKPKEAEKGPVSWQLASGGGDGCAILWDLQTAREVHRLEVAEADGVLCLTFSPDGEHLAAGTASRSVRIWNANTGVLERILGQRGPNPAAPLGHTLWGHKQAVTALAYRADGKQLLSGSEDRTIKLWDLETDRDPLTLSGHLDRVEGVAFLSVVEGEAKDEGREERDRDRERRRTSTVLLSVGADGVLKFWDPSGDQPSRTLRDEVGSIQDLAFSPEGRRILYRGESDVVHVRDLRTGRQILRLARENVGLTTMAVSPALPEGGYRIACGCKDQTIIVWDETGKVRALLPGHAEGGQIKVLAFRKDESRQKDGVDSSLIPHPSSLLLASASADGVIKLWDVVAGKELFSIKGHRDVIQALAFNPTGTLLASGGEDRTVKVWNVEVGPRRAGRGGDREWRMTEALSRSDFGGWVLGLAYCPVRHRGLDILAVANNQGEVVLLGPTPEEDAEFPRNDRRVLRGHNGRVLRLIFSPCGRRLATVGEDHMVKLWDIRTAQEVLTLSNLGQEDPALDIAFSSDGRMLAVGGEDSCLKVWASSSTVLGTKDEGRKGGEDED
jgi:WD40 repeat protein/serine/threonine protein kinase